MDDGLIVSGGGSTAVATAELFSEAARLGALEALVQGWRSRILVLEERAERVAVASIIDALTPTAFGTRDAAGELAGARAALERASNRADGLRAALAEAAERYGAAERAVDWYADLGGRVGAWALGAGLRVLPLPTITIVAGVVAQFALRHGGDVDAMLADPDLVAATAVAGDSVDELFSGLALVPPGLALAAGEDFRTPENASVLLGLTGAAGLVGPRLLVDRGVRVTRADASGRPTGADAAAGAPSGGVVTPPRTVAELAARIPAPRDGEPQVTIERFGTADEPRWVVYIAGTVETSTVAGAQPWDMTNNVHGIADDSPLDAWRQQGADSGGGERAVRMAMADAGIRPGDPIVPVGYSGGGIVAASLAGDPELNTVALLTLGSPVASAELGGTPTLSIQHPDDLIPATGGQGQPRDERLVVDRTALPDAASPDDLAAHELRRYRETARLVTASDEPRLDGFDRLIAGHTGTADGYETRWLAERLSPSTPGEARGR